MILKCFDGPMDGAVYTLSRETSDVLQRSTNRKPDGLWFDGTDEHGRHVQHQYAGGNAMPLVDCKEPVVLEYRYTGPVVDTGLTLETEEHVVGTREREPEQPEGMSIAGPPPTAEHVARISQCDPAGEDEVGSDDPAGKPPTCCAEHANEYERKQEGRKFIEARYVD